MSPNVTLLPYQVSDIGGVGEAQVNSSRPRTTCAPSGLVPATTIVLVDRARPYRVSELISAAVALAGSEHYLQLQQKPNERDSMSRDPAESRRWYTRRAVVSGSSRGDESRRRRIVCRRSRVTVFGGSKDLLRGGARARFSSSIPPSRPFV